MRRHHPPRATASPTTAALQYISQISVSPRGKGAGWVRSAPAGHAAASAPAAIRGKLPASNASPSTSSASSAAGKGGGGIHATSAS